MRELDIKVLSKYLKDGTSWNEIDKMLEILNLFIILSESSKETVILSLWRINSEKKR